MVKMYCIRSPVVITILAVVFAQSDAFSSMPEPAAPSVARRVDPQSLPSAKLNQSLAQQTLALHMSRGMKADIPSPSEQDLNESIGEDADTERKSQRSLVAGLFLSALVAISTAAKAGLLRGGLDAATGDFGPYTNAMILQDVGSASLTAALGYVLVKLITLGYNQELYNSKVSRKLSHTLSAPLFMLFFPIFSEADGARFFAASVTMVNAIRLYLAGTGSDSKLASTISRSGDKSEVLQGPFIYVCLFQLFILLFWRSSMVGIVAMSTMAAGDGMADLVGRRFGKGNKWFFSESKSVAGSTAFAAASSLTSIGLINWLSTTGCLQYSMAPMDLALRVIAISVVCAAVELFPFVDDNYSVPLTAAALTAFLLY